ncbi:hypothetical protein RB653_002331 [Dictyostelium firmibasis]|uniref:ubiquitinyl hydrolase 1 n=1 Tax=Dictyostelium firmibasis TaxID=79012 RepID=A0AAN7TY81_9MYCE
MSENRDVRYLVDFIKNIPNNESKEVIKVVEHVIQILDESEDFFYNFEKFSEIVEVLWFKVSQNPHQNELIQKVDSFFKKIMEVITNRLSQGEDFSPENLKILNLIFSPKPSGYRDYRYQENGDDISSKLSTFEATTFYENGGLKCLITRIQEFKNSFENLKKIVNTIKKITKKVEKFEGQIVEDLIKIVFQKILGATDEEFKNENKKDLDLIIKHLSGIVNNLQYEQNNNSALQDMIHQQSLLVSLKCFKSPSLFQRNAGLNDIIRFCKSENNNNNNSFMLRNQPFSIYVPPQKIVEWLKENQVVELLYGETSHIQLLQKCTDILKFLAEQKSFDRKYLDLVWSASEGKHETIENAIYDTIGTIAPLLPPEDIDYLFEKVQMIPYNHYTQITLNLVRSLTQRSSHQQQQITNSDGTTTTTMLTSKGLDIFWNLIQEDCDVSFEISEASLNTLQESLQYYPSQRGHYLGRCLDRIGNHHSVILCLRLLYQLINSFAEKKKKRDIHGNNSMMNNDVEMANVIENIDQKYHLVELLYKHLVYYTSQCKQLIINGNYYSDKGMMAMNVDGGSDQTHKQPYRPPPGFDDFTFAGGISHIAQIYDYLNFIRFIYEKSSLFLTNQHIDILWNVFVLEPVSNSDRTHFFTWTIEHLRLDEHQVLYFINKFQTLSFTNLDTTGFEFYKFCFNLIKSQNEYNNDNNNNNNIDDNIIGLDDLWRILLEAQNEQVGRAACSFIIEQYKDYKNPEEFLNTCMAKLSKVPINNGSSMDPINYMLVTRCLSLIKKYLEEFGSRSSDSFKKHFSPLITVRFSSQRNTFKLDVKSSESIGIIKQLVANFIKSSEHCICLTFQGKMMVDDCQTIEDFRVGNGDTINFQEIGEPRQPLTYGQPVSINFDQNNFALLFGLLNIQSIAQDVWDLLMLLPVNRHILSEITVDIVNSGIKQQTSTINWDNLFDPKSSYRLLYSLLIIESMVVNDSYHGDGDVIGGSLDGGSGSNEWKQKFISSGGSNHLIKILMTTDLQNPSRGNKRNTCLSVLLRIIYNILEANRFNFSAITSQQIAPADFLNRLIELTWNQVIPTIHEENLSTHETEDAMVVSHLMHLIVAILASNEQLFEVFAKNKNILEWISLVILDSKDTFIRDKAANGIRDICQYISPPISKRYFLEQFLNLLFKNVADDRQSSACQQFFEVLNYLLNDQVQSLVSDASTADVMTTSSIYSELLLKMVEMIKTQPIIESTAIYQPDVLLMGLLNLVKILIQDNNEFKLLAGQKGGLVKEIFHECLFNIATADNHGATCPPKCKTKESRDICFAVLLELAKGCEKNLREITTLLMEHHKPEEKRLLWSYYPAGNEKSTCGYVGLKNLGATCYINSLMQQLFMIPGFRYNIIQSEEKYNSPQEQQESLLYQLKIIFANLQESEKKSHDPKDFCLTYKYDGQPINTSIQMDADEFFNMLFDKLENTLKSTPQEKLLKDFFGGSSVNQFISQECNHVSEREEPFYTISVEVKNKKEIQESLQLFVESETLDGDNKYFCSSCSQKVKALMRRCIKDLPNTLIIHNKRFEFDLDLMKRTKLNDALRFPMTIDMEPYTKEYLERKEAIEKAKEKGEQIPEAASLHPPSYYQYELAGILVHTGTADSGHYYSYIKEREPNCEGQPRRWILFNDQATEVFNPEDISKACFGGYDQSDHGKGNFRGGPRVNNAYMLFYERSYIQGEMIKKYENVQPSEASKLVPKDMFSSVWKKNMKFLNDKNIFDPNYFSFLLNIIKLDESSLSLLDSNNKMDFISSQELLKGNNNAGSDSVDDLNNQKLSSTQDNESGAASENSGGAVGFYNGEFNQTMQSIELGTRFLVETLFHSKDRKMLGDTVNYLISLYERNLEACYWLLNTIVEQQGSDNSWIRQVLLTCVTFEPREALMKLLLSVIKTLIPSEKEKYGLDEDNEMMSENSGAPITSIDEDDEDDEDSMNTGTTKGKQKASSQMNYDQDEIFPSFSTLKKPKSIIFKFMDVFLDYIKEAPIHWKHFSYYFMFIKEFSLLGEEERKYLVNRNVIGRLIDFFLGDESQLSKTYPPHKKPKMGDKYNNPQFIYMIEAVNILVRSCHTRYSKMEFDKKGTYQNIPSQVCLNLIPMPENDMELLYDPVFVAKAIKENSLIKPITEIISYICFNDIDTTNTITQYIEGFDQGKTSLEVLLPLITLDDQCREERVDIAIPHYINILEENFKSRGSLPFLKSLVEAAQQYGFIADWFKKNFDRWVTSWLVGSEHSEVRSEAFTLLIHINQLTQEQPDHDAIIETFSFLCSVETIKYAKKICKKDKDHRGIFKFEYYFKLLRLSLVATECKQIFTQVATLFYGFITDIIFQQNEIDRNRQELTHFLVDVLRDQPDNIALLQKEPCSSKLMDYFISISTKEDLKQFNQKSLPSFYELLYILACDKHSFLEYVIGHPNFEWACKFLLCECGEYQDISVFLFNILELIPRAPKYAQALINHFLVFQNFFFYPTNSLKVMDILTFSKKEAIYFINSQGITVFSKFLSSSKDSQENTRQYPKAIDIIFKVLTLIRSPPSPSSQPDPSSSPKSNVIVIDEETSSSSNIQNPTNINVNELTTEVKILSTVLYSIMDNSEIVCQKAQKLLNFIAVESPDTTILTFSEFVTKWINKKNSMINNNINSINNNNMMNSINLVDSDPKQPSIPQFSHGNPSQHYPSPFVQSNQQPQSSPIQQSRLNQQLLTQFSFSETFFNALIDIVLMSMQSAASQNLNPSLEPKASISLGKLVKEILNINMEMGSRILSRVIDSLKIEDRNSVISHCIEHNYIGTSETSPTTPASLNSLYHLIKSFLQDKANEETVNNLCTDIEDKVTTAIVSIQSLENFNINEIDNHLLILTNALRQIQLLDNCYPNGKSKQSLSNTITSLNEFANKDCCNIQSENVRLFLTSFKSIRSPNN